MPLTSFIDLKKLLMAVFVSSSFYATNMYAADGVSCTNENTNIVATTEHLTDNNNGTITDPETGLIWKKCIEGQTWSSAGNDCTTGIADTFNWQTALQRAQAVNDNSSGENFSQTDWRLPNIKELATIVELRCSSPAINNAFFPQTPADLFWSSSPYAPFSANAWGVDFGNNGDDSARAKGFNDSVRLVRSGQ